MAGVTLGLGQSGFGQAYTHPTDVSLCPQDMSPVFCLLPPPPTPGSHRPFTVPQTIALTCVTELGSCTVKPSWLASCTQYLALETLLSRGCAPSCGHPPQGKGQLCCFQVLAIMSPGKVLFT